MLDLKSALLVATKENSTRILFDYLPFSLFFPKVYLNKYTYGDERKEIEEIKITSIAKDTLYYAVGRTEEIDGDCFPSYYSYDEQKTIKLSELKDLYALTLEDAKKISKPYTVDKIRLLRSDIPDFLGKGKMIKYLTSNVPEYLFDDKKPLKSLLENVDTEKMKTRTFTKEEIDSLGYYFLQEVDANFEYGGGTYSYLTEEEYPRNTQVDIPNGSGTVLRTIGKISKYDVLFNRKSLKYNYKLATKMKKTVSQTQRRPRPIMF